MAFLEAADRRIGRHHLFKRSILLVRCDAIRYGGNPPVGFAPGEAPGQEAQLLFRMQPAACIHAPAASQPANQPTNQPTDQQHLPALLCVLPCPLLPTPLQLKAWCYYESRLLGAHHGLISSYALEVLVLHIFNLHHAQLHTPLDVRLAVGGLGGLLGGGHVGHCRCCWELPCQKQTAPGSASRLLVVCVNPARLPAFSPCPLFLPCLALPAGAAALPVGAGRL